VYGHDRRRRLSPEKYATVFHAEVYAIKACAVENLDINYKNKNIYEYIVSDSQATIKSLGKYQIT
jgi:hypothetical protein